MDPLPDSVELEPASSVELAPAAGAGVVAADVPETPLDKADTNAEPSEVAATASPFSPVL